jgi:hypothetical protein
VQDYLARLWATTLLERGVPVTAWFIICRQKYTICDYKRVKFGGLLDISQQIP